MSRIKINLLLINPSPMPMREQAEFLNKASILRLPDFSMPIGLIELAAYVRKQVKGANIAILDIAKDLHKVFMNRDAIGPMTVESFINSELNTVDFKPDIVGISIMYSTSHQSSLKIAELVEKKWNDAIVVCGGNHATTFYDKLLLNQNINYIVRGEAELSFCEFLKKFKHANGKIIEADILGIYDFKKFKKSQNKNELSLMIEDLDEVPLPAYDLLDISLYKKTSNVLGEGRVSVMLSRGCIFKCTFCASQNVHGRKVRHKSNDRIMIEIQHVYNELNFEKIIIYDDLFPADKKKFLDLSKKIENFNHVIKFELPNALNVCMLDEEIIDAMASMRINLFRLAIESGSAYTQKYIINKNIPLDKAKRILKYMRQKELRIEANFILGFPGETRELMQETIDFIYSLDVDWVLIFAALPLPGTEMFQQFVKIGVIDPVNYDWDSCRMPLRNFDTPEISAKELEQLVYDVNINCNFFNNANLRNHRYNRAINYFNFMVLDRYPFHIVAYYCRALAYRGLQNEEKAVADFRRCAQWVRSDKESRRLYERYGDKMPLLKPYLNNGLISEKAEIH